METERRFDLQNRPRPGEWVEVTISQADVGGKPAAAPERYAPSANDLRSASPPPRKHRSSFALLVVVFFLLVLAAVLRTVYDAGYKAGRSAKPAVTKSGKAVGAREVREKPTENGISAGRQPGGPVGPSRAAPPPGGRDSVPIDQPQSPHSSAPANRSDVRPNDAGVSLGGR